MSRPSKMQKKDVGALSSVNCHGAPEGTNLAEAAALLECQIAMIKSSAEARTALSKHQALIAPKLAQALERVGSYTENEHGRTPLHEAVVNGDAATVEALIVAASPMLIDAKDSNGATPLDLAIDATCRKILEHHAAAYTSITKDPTTLVAAALAHCAALSASEKPLPATALSLGAHHFDPCFLWAPLAARAAVVAWARNAFIFQLAATSHIQKDLPDDCIGDVLEFFVTTHKESELFAKHCTSPEARVWVRNVVAAAVVSKATAELVPAAKEGDLVTVQNCLTKKANIETQVCGSTALINASMNGRAEIVKFLLESGADKDVKGNIHGFTALMKATRWGHTHTMQLLVEAKADVNAKNMYGYTALMWASDRGAATSVKLLLKAGADKDAKDNDDRTALKHASVNGHTAVVRLFLDFIQEGR